MSTKRKRNSVHPARAAEGARRYRVQRQDGVILAEHLTRQKAEAIAADLTDQHTSMTYQVKEERPNAPVVSIGEYLQTQKGTPTNVPDHPLRGEIPGAHASA